MFPPLSPQMFFSFLSLALMGVRYRSDKRDLYLHHGNWLLKLGLWLAFCILPFFFPNGLVNAYGAASYAFPCPQLRGFVECKRK